MLRIGSLLSMTLFLTSSLQTWAAADDPAKSSLKWHDDVLPAFEIAIESNKPLVIYFHEDWCKFCKDQAVELRPAKLGRFAKDAVFVQGVPSKDAAANQIATRFGINSYPTFTIIEPNMKQLIERARLNGFFETDKIDQQFDRLLKNYKKQTTPIVTIRGGGSLTPSSSQCELGDIECLLKALPINQPGPAKDIDNILDRLSKRPGGIAPVKNDGMTMDRLGTLLKSAGYQSTRRTSRYAIKLDKPDIRYRFTVSPSPDQTTVWIETTFGAPPGDREVPAKLLYRILSENGQHGAANFALRPERQLSLSLPLVASSLNAGQLQQAIEDFIATVQDTTDIWTEYNNWSRSK